MLILVFEFANSDVAKLDVVRLTVILEADIALQGPIFHGAFIELNIDDLFAIQFDLKVAADARDDHPIPLVWKS